MAARLKTAQESYGIFSGNFTNSKTGLKVAIAERNTSRTKMDEDLEKLIIGLNFYALDDPKLLEGLGIPLVKVKGSSKPSKLEKPTGVTAVNKGNSGSVEVSVENAPGAGSFVFEYTLDPVTDSSVWTSKGSMTKSYTFHGLPSKTTVWFRVLAVGSHKQELMSDSVSCVVI